MNSSIFGTLITYYTLVRLRDLFLAGHNFNHEQKTKRLFSHYQL